MTIEQFIEQAREIESKSTEGPWGFTYDGSSDWTLGMKNDPQSEPVVGLWSKEDTTSLETLRFIAHAKNTYKPLLDALTVAINNMESIDDEWPGELETRTDEEWKVIALVLMKGNRDSLAKIQTILGAGE